MKLLNIKKGNGTSIGVKTSEGIIDIAEVSFQFSKDLPVKMEDLIQSGENGLKEIYKIIHVINPENYHYLDEDKIEFASVLSNPEKIICVGLNYISHAKESNMEIPSFPVLFSKFNNTLTGHKNKVKLPKTAEKFDYEAELAVVIGKTARNVAEKDALSYVFGYSVANDLSARDLQMRTGQWLLGKTCDGFAPIGPFIVTTDELSDPDNLEIVCTVNGEIRQKANTRDMIFNCSKIISYISQYMTYTEPLSPQTKAKL